MALFAPAAGEREKESIQALNMKITVKKIIKGFRYLKHYGLKEFIIRLQEKMEAENVPYGPWYARHAASAQQLVKQRRTAEKWQDGPLISIIVPLFCTPENLLNGMIESVLAQTYGKWELCLADGSPKEALSEIIAPYAKRDARIIYRKLQENKGIAGNTNAAVELSSGDWIAFLDHDDLLAPDALYEAARLIREGDRAMEPYDMVYTDEDKVDMEGKVHFQPHLKPDINIDLLRSNNYITHFLLVRREIAKKAGGFRSEYDGAQDYDFILRCVENCGKIGHIPRILYHWRTHEASTADNPFAKQYAVDAGKRAIADHLERLGIEAKVTPAKDMGFYFVEYPVQGEPLVSVIIPSRNEVESLKKCIASVMNSDYMNYEIIIAENNSDKETFRYYESITKEKKIGSLYCSRDGKTKITPEVYEGTLGGGQRICIAVWKEGFNYSKLNNFGVSQAKGSFYVLLNNDIEIIGRKALSRMLGVCQRREVGIVGAKLYYPDDTIQHAGIVVGIGGNARGIADNLFSGMPRERSGYMHKASLMMDYSAVTAAFLMVKRDVYEVAGGMTEELAVAFNDVDFCLKVREMGYLVVYQPKAEAYHYESKSRGAEDSPEKVERFQREIEYMRSHWISILKNGDPYYNPNFSNVYNNYSLKDNS